MGKTGLIRLEPQSVARIVAGVALVTGIVLLVAPPLARDLDRLVGPDHDLETVMQRTETVYEDPVVAPVRTTYRTITERRSVRDESVLGFILALPGQLFLVRTLSLLLVAFLVAVIAHAFATGTFQFSIGGVSLGASVRRQFETAFDTLDREAGAAQAERQEVGEPGLYRAIPVTAEAARATVAEMRRTRRRKYEILRDPRLAAAALYLDLSEGLLGLAARHDLTVEDPYAIVQQLRDRRVLGVDVADAIAQMLRAGQRAASGVRVPAELTEEIRSRAPRLLEILEWLTRDAGTPWPGRRL